ncbi:hypothetical protein [Chitinophaga silvisoli]|uniref:Uncharacterized protein n=1 Tax=Chitinophaga silvisoli TaxID=2291814 RepID=A0A3E1P0V9_9BACT|nr:hypothetical protein [Chitinophaga silvisoli]RFM33760.1 hypothetical protein DXN04_17525 [Chitinophaga silvisoli]
MSLFNAAAAKNFLRIIAITLVPVCVALLYHLLFSFNTLDDLYGVMTVGFLFGVPMGLGALAIFLSRGHFKLSTPFNFYAGLWAKWIMQDIQDTILQVLKTRCEKNRDVPEDTSRFD